MSDELNPNVLLTQYPSLKDFLHQITANKKSNDLPPSMQLKNKSADMLTDIVANSRTLNEYNLREAAVEKMQELGENALRDLYHGFVVDREIDRRRLYDENAVYYVQFSDGKLPLQYAVPLLLLITACKDDPIQIGTRSFMFQIARWLERYQCFLAFKLNTIFN